MENLKKCSKCQKSLIQSKFEKFKSGKIKKVCMGCCFKNKKNHTNEEKIYLNLKKVHKELHKHFEPIRRKEYYNNYNDNYQNPKHKRCPVFGFMIRTCSHCKHPERYQTEIKTMGNKKILLNELTLIN